MMPVRKLRKKKICSKEIIRYLKFKIDDKSCKILLDAKLVKNVILAGYKFFKYII